MNKGYKFFSNVEKKDLWRYEKAAQSLGVTFHIQKAHKSMSGKELPDHVALYLPLNIQWNDFQNEVPKEGW